MKIYFNSSNSSPLNRWDENTTVLMVGDTSIARPVVNILIRVDHCKQPFYINAGADSVSIKTNLGTSTTEDAEMLKALQTKFAPKLQALREFFLNVDAIANGKPAKRRRKEPAA